MQGLAHAGQPVLTIPTRGAADLGRIFFFAEFATAVSGWALGINPFDQPNVQEAKDNTKRVLESGELPRVPDALDDGLDVLIGEAGPERYVAILAFVPPSGEFDAAIEELRRTIRDGTRSTTTFGYGPRYLHSTGQFHKGGPPTGRFLQLVGDVGPDVEVPGESYTFRHLEHAQALGDLQTLESHGLPVKRVRLEGDLAAGVREITKRVERMR
jgi:glucose-6-phosphate isomerase/transaldolase/glucose-6-phosphate isomerase